MAEHPSGPDAGGPSGPRASFWSRAGALIVDGILLAIVYSIVTALLGRGLGDAINIALGLGYFTYFEGSARGQTLGKRLLGIRVIDFRTGSSIGYGRAVLRYVGRILSSLPLGLGYWWMIWDKEKQTWHDKIATSVVVPASDYPVD